MPKIMPVLDFAGKEREERAMINGPLKKRWRECGGADAVGPSVSWAAVEKPALNTEKLDTAGGPAG